MRANTTTIITARIVAVDDEFIDVIDTATGQEYDVYHYEGDTILDAIAAGQEISCTIETEYVEDFATGDMNIQHTLVEYTAN